MSKAQNIPITNIKRVTANTTTTKSKITHTIMETITKTKINDIQSQHTVFQTTTIEQLHLLRITIDRNTKMKGIDMPSIKINF